MATPVYLEPRQWWLWLSGLVGSRYDGLAHFAVVEPGVLLRCGQPRLRDLETIRAQHGLRTIVCARGGTRHPLRGRWFRKQQRYAEQHGIRLMHMPFSDAQRPPNEVFDRFVACVSDPQARPVLVHCEQGLHRTGVLVAAYRIALQHWTLDAARTEMYYAGFEIQRPKRQGLLDALAAWYESRARGVHGELR